MRGSQARGETPLGTGLNGAIEYARDRGMPLLEAELRLARGAARAHANVRGGEEDMDLAVGIAEKTEALVMEGRARVMRRKAGFLRNDLERTRLCLAGDRVWLAALDAAPGVARPW